MGFIKQFAKILSKGFSPKFLWPYCCVYHEFFKEFNHSTIKMGEASCPSAKMIHVQELSHGLLKGQSKVTLRRPSLYLQDTTFKTLKALEWLSNRIFSKKLRPHKVIMLK